MDDRAVIRSFESGMNRRVIAFVVVAVIVLVGLIAVVVSGFRDRHIKQGAAAVTKPLMDPTHVRTQPGAPTR